jgi:2C-methyl-D-erythritol 2,4-cyclodiphosphate synthase
MALKLVGAVGIKIRPDSTNFRRDAESQIKKATDGLSADIELNPTLKAAARQKVKEEARAVAQEASGEDVTLNVVLDKKGIDAALKDIEDRIRKAKYEETIKVTTDVKELEALKADLEELRKGSNIELKYVDDQQGLRDAIARLKENLRTINEKTISVEFDETKLKAQIAELEAQSMSKTIHIEYDRNEAGLRSAIAKIDAELAGRRQVQVDVSLDEESLRAKLVELNAELALVAKKTVTPKVKPEVSKTDEVKADAELAFLSRDRIMKIRTTVANDSLLVFAKLTGLRAATNWSKEFAESLGTLDSFLPVVSAVTLGVSQMAAAVTSLGGNIASLGVGVAQIGALGLLGPALLGGLISSAVVMTAVFKDFGAAVNGDAKALARLSPAGQQAAREIGPVFAMMRENMSRSFWDAASNSMLNFTHTALPAFSSGFGQLAKSMGSGLAGILDSFNRFAQQDGVRTQFALLSAGIDIANKGAQNFWEALNTLGAVGSQVFPRLGQAFTDVSAKFNNWVQKITADGSLSTWVNRGIQNLKDLGSAVISAGKVWANIGQAAQAGGALTTGKLAAMMARLDEVTADSRFQTNMQRIFQGATVAMDTFEKALGALGPDFDQISKTINTIFTDASAALSVAIQDIGAVLSSPSIESGFAAFLGGVKKMFQDLAPAAQPVAEIIGNIGHLLGTVASDAGPLFRDLFRNLSTIFASVVSAVEPLLPDFIEIGRTVVNNLGPALNSIAQNVLPAVLQGFQSLGPAVEEASRIISSFTQFVSTAFSNKGQASGSAGTKMDFGVSSWIDEMFGNSARNAADQKQAEDTVRKGISDAWDWLTHTKLTMDGFVTDKGVFGGAGGTFDAIVPKAKGAADAMLAAAQVAKILGDTSQTGASQVDAMRQSLKLLSDQQNGTASVRDSTSQMIEHLNTFKDTAAALKPALQELSQTQIFTPDGLLNIDSGNKAVLTLRDTLSSAATDVLANAKNIYNAARQNGDTVDVAMQKAQDAVTKGNDNLQAIADAAGVSVDSLKGEWQTFFGQPWQLTATFTGTTDKFLAAKQEAESLGIQFDGEEFQAWLLANPDPANVSIDAVNQHMDQYAQSRWTATLDALPAPAQQQIQNLVGMTDAQWKNADWTAVMRAAQSVPGLPQALAQLLAVKNGDYTAAINAIAYVAAAEAALNAVARARTATISVQYTGGDSLPGNVSGVMHAQANGGILFGNYRAFAQGGFNFENHVAQIARPGVVPRVWAEPETQGEAYIPYAMSKRGRSTQILGRVAGDFGYRLVKQYANGGTTVNGNTGPSYHAPVHVENLITHDPDAAVAALQRKRRDALAVAGIRPF